MRNNLHSVTTIAKVFQCDEFFKYFFNAKTDFSSLIALSLFALYDHATDYTAMESENEMQSFIVSTYRLAVIIMTSYSFSRRLREQDSISPDFMIKFDSGNTFLSY